MRQVQIQDDFGIDHVQLVEAPSPVPAAHQVLVRVHAASLNYRDFLVVTGQYNPKMPLPRVLLSDGAGEVIGVGPEVTGFKIGDRVAGTFFQNWTDGPYAAQHSSSALGGAIDGVLADEVVLSDQGLVHIPDHLSYAEAATLPCAALTAWNALFESAHLQLGKTVLIMGTGGVSIFALQFARSAGAKIIATTGSPEKAERLKSLGAHTVINYKETPDWGREVARLGGADIVVEVGGAGTLEQSLLAANPSGTVAVIGVLTGRIGQINTGLILHKTLRVQGIYVGSRAMFHNMNRVIRVNHLKPIIDSTFDISQTREALRHLESAKHFGKVVITLS